MKFRDILFLILALLDCLLGISQLLIIKGVGDLEATVYSEPVEKIVEVEKEIYVYMSDPDEFGTTPPWSPVEVEYIAKCVKGEAGRCDKKQQSGVVWCILNRVDDERYPNTIIEVVAQPNQFHGYRASNSVDEDIVALVEDVLWRWYLEKKYGLGDYGRTLPKDYLYFVGDGRVNHFCKKSGSKNYWDWSWGDPYGLHS